MLRSLNQFIGYNVSVLDGDAGKLKDFLFDDEFWTIRYLVLNTGNWLREKLVILSPRSVENEDLSCETLSLNLTKDKVEAAPDLSTDEPVSRSHEKELLQHYGWPLYWESAAIAMPRISPVVITPDGEDADESEEDNHLRSLKEVTGYGMNATDGNIGHVEDLIVDDANWGIRYLVVDTRNILPFGKKTLLSPYWIEEINFSTASVNVDLPATLIKESPEYHPDKPIKKSFEIELHDHFKKPIYWK